MPCYHPLCRVTPDVGATPYITCGNYYYVATKDLKKELIPCGQCRGCRVNKAAEWAMRICLESFDHDEDSNHFITLTYNDENLPIGELGLPTLRPKDVTDFLKRLRARTGQKIRYYYSGEYGDESGRPHYHMIVFGLHLDDLKLHNLYPTPYPLYTSELIYDLWKFGDHKIGALTFDTAEYTAGYVCKKLTGAGAGVYEQLGTVPEFSRMSRRPGIAARYFSDEIARFVENPEKPIYLKDGKRIVLPKFFRDKMKDSGDYIEYLDFVKNFSIKMKNLLTDRKKYDIMYQLEIEEREFLRIQELKKRRCSI